MSQKNKLLQAAQNGFDVNGLKVENEHDGRYKVIYNPTAELGDTHYPYRFKEFTLGGIRMLVEYGNWNKVGARWDPAAGERAPPEVVRKVESVTGLDVVTAETGEKRTLI